MNWTGGRLRRQSHNRPGSLSRIQKQYFARARVKLRDISNRTAASQTLPTLENNDRRPGESDTNTVRPVQSKVNQEGGKDEELQISQTGRFVYQGLDMIQRRSEQLSFSQIPHKSNDDPPYSELPRTQRQDTRSCSRTSQLENIKLRLLHQTDWAGISVTRPLRMKFPSTEEKENVGKRRRITKADDRRQTSAAKRPFRSEFSPIHRSHGYRDKVFHNDDALDSISITINGYRANRPLGDDGHKPAPRQASSESMLLDGDEGGSHELRRPRTESLAEHERLSLQAGVVDLSSEDTMRSASAHSCQAVVTTEVPSDLVIDNTEDHRTSNEAATAISTAEFQRNINGSLSSSPQSSRLPVLHRFTLDDQVIAERENELQKSLSSTGPQSIPHMHNSISQPSPELLFRSGDYSESHFNNSDRITGSGDNQRRPPAQSFVNNQTGSGLWRERQREPIDFFATPNRRTSTQDTESPGADWNIHDRSASKNSTSPPIFFGQPIPQSLHAGIDEVHTPSPCSSRFVEHRSQSGGGERSHREQSRGSHMATPRFSRGPSAFDLLSSAHADNTNFCDDDRKFAANIHCRPNPTRSSFYFHQNRTIMSPVIPEKGAKEGQQREYQTELLSHLASASASPAQFRFPAYWTPQQERLRTSVPSTAATAVSASVSPEKRMQISPVPHHLSPSPFHSPLISRSTPFVLRESHRKDYGREPEPDAFLHVDNNTLAYESANNTMPPFFNAPFRR